MLELVRTGGVLSLDMGFDLPLHVAIHRTQTRRGATIILSIGNKSPNTRCFTVSDTDAEIYLMVIESKAMSNATQAPLRLRPAPESTTIELLYRTFGDVLIPLETVREKYFRNLNEQKFVIEINSGRIQLPITTLDSSRKAPKYAHIRHVASLIDIRAYQADEDMQSQQDALTE